MVSHGPWNCFHLTKTPQFEKLLCFQVWNGPGLFEMGSRSFSHTFDGYAKLIAWNFLGPNRTLFNSDFIQSNSLRKSKHRNTIAPYILFDEPSPKFSWKQKALAFFRQLDNCPVNVLRFGAHGSPTYVAVTDFWRSYRFDPENLQTLGLINPAIPGVTGKLSVSTGMSSAHPLPEHGTANFISFVLLENIFGLDATIRLVRITSGKGRKPIRDIRVPRISYMHSFGLSKNYVALFVFPMYVDREKMISKASVSKSFQWKAMDGMKIFVVNLHNKAMFSIKTEAMFLLHFVNSFEEGDLVHIDYITYEDPVCLQILELACIRNASARNSVPWAQKIRRFSINVASKTVQIRSFPDTPGFEHCNRFDFPIINPGFLYHKNCYVYGIAPKIDGINWSAMAIIKKDLCRAGQDRAWAREDHYPSEVKFVPNPNGSDEDDGLLLSQIMDGNSGVSYLAIFDASSMTLINVAYLPIPTTFTFHGQYFPRI